VGKLNEPIWKIQPSVITAIEHRLDVEVDAMPDLMERDHSGGGRLIDGAPSGARGIGHPERPPGDVRPVIGRHQWLTVGELQRRGA